MLEPQVHAEFYKSKIELLWDLQRRDRAHHPEKAVVKRGARTANLSVNSMECQIIK